MSSAGDMSTEKSAVRITGAPRPAGPYSQGIVGGGMIFTAGFGPQDPVTGEVAEGAEEQTRQALRNISAVLAEAGATLGDVVKATVHLQHLHRDYDAFNRAYREFFVEPYPVRTTVGSDLQHILVEIDVIALAPASSS